MMKPTFFCLLFALISLSVLVKSEAQSSPSAVAFTGTWTLDREKTNTSKDFPRKLKNYRITVDENERILRVKSEVDGRVEIEVSRDQAASNSDIVSNTSGRTSAPPTTGVSSSTLGTAATQKANYGGTMAIFFTPNEATYNLSGEEVKVEIKQGDKVTGLARIKTKLDKSGNQIQFTNIRRMNTLKGDIEITTREVWKLSRDGKSLRFERTVETPTARDEIVLVLIKTA
jgi:hypothetical protein